MPELRAILGLDGKKFDRELAKTKRQLTGFGRDLGTIGSGLTAGVTLPLAGVAAGALIASENLSRGMANVATLIPGAGDRVKELKGDVQSLAVETGTSTEILTAGLYQTVSAFGDTAETADRLAIATKTAKAGIAEVGPTVSLLSAATKAYGDTSAGAVQKVSDLALATVRYGETDLPQLASSMGKVLPLGAELKVSQEELFAVIAAGTGPMGNTAEVSTKLSQVLVNLLKPTKELPKVYSLIGVESGQALIEQYGFAGGLQKVKDTAEANNLTLADLFDSSQALQGVLSLTGNQAEDFAYKLGELEQASGVMDAAYAEQTEGVNALGHSWDVAKQRGVVLAQNMGDALAPAAIAVLDAAEPLLGVIENLVATFANASPEAQKLTLGIAAAAAAAGPLLIVAGHLVTSAGVLAPLALRLAASFVATGTAATGAATGVTTLNVRLLTVKGTLKGLGLVSLAAGFAYLGVAAGQKAADPMVQLEDKLYAVERALKANEGGVREVTASLELQRNAIQQDIRELKIQRGEIERGGQGFDAYWMAADEATTAVEENTVAVTENTGAAKANKREWEILDAQTRTRGQMLLGVREGLAAQSLEWVTLGTTAAEQTAIAEQGVYDLFERLDEGPETLGTLATAFEGFGDAIAGTFARALEGGGGFLGAIGSVGVQAGERFGESLSTEIAERMPELGGTLGTVLNGALGVALPIIGPALGAAATWIGGKLFGGNPSEAEKEARKAFAGVHASIVNELDGVQEYADYVQGLIQDGWDRTLAETVAGFVYFGQQAGLTHDEAVAHYARYQQAVSSGNTELVAQIESDFQRWQEAAAETARKSEESIRTVISAWESAQTAGQRAYDETMRKALESGATQEEAAAQASAAQQDAIQETLNAERDRYIRTAAFEAALHEIRNGNAEGAQAAAQLAAQQTADAWDIGLSAVMEADQVTSDAIVANANAAAVSHEDAAGRTAAAWQEAAREPVRFEIEYHGRRTGEHGGEGGESDFDVPQLSGGTGGAYPDWGSGTLVQLHGRERVMTSSERAGDAAERQQLLAMMGRLASAIESMPSAIRRGTRDGLIEGAA